MFMCKNEGIRLCKENGHIWKVYRKDRLTTDYDTQIILYMKCKVCGIIFNTSDNLDEDIIYDEKDWDGLR